MSQERIALLTYKDEPELVDAQKLLPGAFANSGIEAVAAPWDGDVDWTKFSTLILRACWNYHLKRDEFIGWLGEQAGNGKNIWNPLETIKWNTDKHYLLDLEAKGVKIIPTVILEPGDTTKLSEILTVKGWNEAVVKPTIGASAFEVKRFNNETASDIQNQLDITQPWIIQKFCPQINTEGEYSIIFFGREYSHSAIKNPKTDDFRTQPGFGGTEHTINPDPEIINQAKRAIDVVDGKLLYARVDGVILEDGNFHLMELELTEPYLFLDSGANAPQNFVDAYNKLK